MVGNAAQRRTDGCRFNHVANCKSFDRLILGCTSRAVGASDWLDVASPFLVTSAMDEFFSTLVFVLKTGIMDRGFRTLTRVS